MFQKRNKLKNVKSFDKKCSIYPPYIRENVGGVKPRPTVELLFYFL